MKIRIFRVSSSFFLQSLYVEVYKVALFKIFNWFLNWHNIIYALFINKSISLKINKINKIRKEFNIE